VRLLGVRESPTANGKAVEFLLKKTEGQKVFIRHDSPIYDENNIMLCYLYLKNKDIYQRSSDKEWISMRGQKQKLPPEG
jgi:site-specific DNA-methyltransferase (adenine-specific)